MDETAICSDMPSFTTLCPKKIKLVPMLSTGHEITRTTIALTALADVTKLPPFVIFKGKRVPVELSAEYGVVVAISENGWMA